MFIEYLKDKKVILVIIIIILCSSFVMIISAPYSFPSQSIITVSEGTGLHSLSVKLNKDRVIRSPFWFRIFAIILGGERNMKAGQYYLANPQNSFSIAWRIFHGDYGVKSVKITIPEGFTIKKISSLFDEKFIFFDHQTFESSALEGYLFPDTYFVQITATASSTIKIFTDNFSRKLKPLSLEIEKSKRTLEEIITMASIVEGEANNKIDMKIVAGILWKRLDKGIPLQVDTTFVYINGKTTKDLTKTDLKIKSPYNTYLNKGLPPTPISNPGLASIDAVLNPTATPFLYFLTSNDGQMHYSRTFDEHVANKLKYLK